MKKTIIKCDCCRKELQSGEYMELRLPIRTITDEGVKMRPHDMEMCQGCANRFLNLYYAVCGEFHNSGIHAIVVGDGAEEG